MCVGLRKYSILSYESTFRKYFRTFVLYESILFSKVLSKVLSYGSTRTVHVLCVSVYLIIKRLCSNPSGQNIWSKCEQTTLRTILSRTVHVYVYVYRLYTYGSTFVPRWNIYFRMYFMFLYFRKYESTKVLSYESTKVRKYESTSLLL